MSRFHTIRPAILQVLAGPNDGIVLIVAGNQAVLDHRVGRIVKHHHQMSDIWGMVMMIVALRERPFARNRSAVVEETETVLHLQFIWMLDRVVQEVVERRAITIQLGRRIITTVFVPVSRVLFQCKVIHHSHSATLSVVDDGRGRG